MAAKDASSLPGVAGELSLFSKRCIPPAGRPAVEGKPIGVIGTIEGVAGVADLGKAFLRFEVLEDENNPL